MIDYIFQIISSRTSFNDVPQQTFTQRHGDNAIIMKRSGIHPAGFVPVISKTTPNDIGDSPQGSSLDGNEHIKFASMINVP